MAIVTGAPQSMGEAHARLVVAEGARVVLTDINSRDGERVARELGDAAVFAPHHVANADDWGRVVALANERFGPVSVLVNNADIPVNSVHPGYILTPMMVAATDEKGGGAADLIPLGRLVQPDEVSRAVPFLASDETSFVSGAEHVVYVAMIAG